VPRTSKCERQLCSNARGECAIGRQLFPTTCSVSNGPPYSI
jgi:hypothetical protein